MIDPQRDVTSEERVMDSVDSPATSWLEKEAAVYYKVFWLPLGLLLLHLLLGLAFILIGNIGLALLFVIPLFVTPYVELFVSSIFTLWGAVLILLAVRQRGRVHPLIIATIVCSTPLFLVLGVWLLELV